MRNLLKPLFVASSLCALALSSCHAPKESVSTAIGRDPQWMVGTEPALQIQGYQVGLNGFTNALIQEIAKETRLELQIQDFNWSELFTELDRGHLAAILSPLSPAAILPDKYSFSAPIVALGPVLIVPSGSSARQLSELEGKIVAVNQFDESILAVQRYPSILIRLYQSMPEILESLKEGEVDAVLMPLLDAEALVPQLYPNQLKIASSPLTDQAIRLITLKEKHQTLLPAFNQALHHLRLSGRYDTLYSRYMQLP